MLSQEDKMSYKSAALPGASIFQYFIDNNYLMNLCIKGPHYTWTNYREGEDVVLEKLDRFLCSMAWMEMFPDHSNSNLSIFRLDHSPLFMDTWNKPNFYPRPARFEAWWLKAPEAITIMKENWTCTNSHLYRVMRTNSLILKELRQWNKERHGNLKERIKNTTR